MKKRPGIIVELKDGRKGIAYNDECLPFSRLLIRLINDKYEPLTDDTGKKIISCKHTGDVKLIGYID